MNSILEPPPPTRWNVINLGAGVQSSTMALMAAHHEIEPMPDFAVFADTGDEPTEVYRWLEKLEKMLPFPVYRVSKGILSADSLKIHRREDGSEYIRRLIPADSPLLK
jgi:3'-phosphoadenosine 5'-phosphosulfate sulfotransferase (PAPS reductase)/FAD synthetase